MRGQKLPAFYIGMRYLLARRDNRFISFTSLISMAGLTLGVLALIVVLSVFNGSQGIQRDRTLITVPHGDVWTNETWQDWLSAAALLETQSQVMAVAPYAALEALLSQQGYHQISQVRGIIPALETRVSTLGEHMLEGSLEALVPGDQKIVIGRALANNLRLLIGDPLNLVVPRTSASGNRVSLELHRFTVAGIFDVQYNIGSDLAYIHLDDMQALSGGALTAGSLHLRLLTSDIHQAASIVQDSLTLLNQQLPGQDYQGQDWSVAEASLFNALKLEKIMTGFMLMMIVAIGAFNIVSTLVMVVAEKQADIAILRTMGAGQWTVMGVFLVQGSVIGVFGIVLGALGGVLMASYFDGISSLLEALLNPDGMYLLSQLPAELQLPDVVVTCVAALLISFLATLYPAYKASRIMPAQVLRYE